MWLRVLDSGQLDQDEEGSARFRAALDAAADELRLMGFDPEEVLRASPEDGR